MIVSYSPPTKVQGRLFVLGRFATPGCLQSVGLAILAAVLLWPALFGGGILLALDVARVSLPWGGLPFPTVPHNPILSDTLSQYYPWRHFVYESLRSGVFPLWNPYILAGHPTFASINEQTFYPLNLLLSPFPAERTFGWLAWFHVSVAGIGVRAFANLHLHDDPSAMLAAIAVMFGGPLVVWIEYPMFVSTWCWLGLLFYLVERTLRERRRIWAALSGLVVGLELLGGQTQLSLYLVFLVVPYLLFRLGSMARTKRKDARAALTLAMLSAVIGGAIGSIAYVPAIEFVAAASRAPMGILELRSFAVPLQNAATLLIPNAYGSPARGDFVGWFNYNESALYLGVVPLFLVCLLPFVRPRAVLVAIFGSAIIVDGLLLFGWPPLVTLYWLAPPLRYFGLNRLNIVLTVAVGLVAAACYARLPALDRARWFRTAGVVCSFLVFALLLVVIERGQQARPGPSVFARSDFVRAMIVVVCSAGALIIRVWAPERSVYAWAGPVVLAVDLLAFGSGYNTIVPMNPMGGPPISPLETLPQGVMAPRSLGVPIDQMILGPNLGMLWQIPTPDGYVSEHISRFGTFVSHASPINAELVNTRQRSLYPGGNVVNFGQVRLPYLRLLGVRYLLTAPDPEFIDTLRSPATSTTGPISGSHSVGAVFRPRQDGLNRIDVYPVLDGRPAPPWLALHIKASPSDRDHLAYIRMAGSKIEEGQPLTFWFKPIEDSGKRSLYFYVDAPDARSRDALRLALSAAPGSPDALLVDDHPATGALAFASYAGLGDPWHKQAVAHGVAIYENPNTLPRAFVVHRVAPISDVQFYAGLDHGSIDPARVAQVPKHPPVEMTSAPIDPPGIDDSPTAIESASADEVRLGVKLARPGLLVVSNVWYPGWTATVDGIPRPVERVDATFQGVYLPSGRHQVTFRFSPRSLSVGLTLGLGGLVVAVLLIVTDLQIVSQRR